MYGVKAAGHTLARRPCPYLLAAMPQCLDTLSYEYGNKLLSDIIAGKQSDCVTVWLGITAYLGMESDEQLLHTP